MLAKAKQTFQKTLIAFVLSISLAFSVFQFLPDSFSPNFGLGLGMVDGLLEQNSAVASIPADPEPFPYHPHN